MGDDNEDGRMLHETEGDDEERRLFWMAAAIPHGSSWSLAGSLDGFSPGYWDGVSRSLLQTPTDLRAVDKAAEKAHG